MADSPTLRDRLTSARSKAALVLLVLAAMVATGGLATPVLAVALLLGALALAVVVRPALRHHWLFNVLVGIGIAVYGIAYAASQTGAVSLALAALMVLLGALIAANHLGIVPWSDHERRL